METKITNTNAFGEIPVRIKSGYLEFIAVVLALVMMSTCSRNLDKDTQDEELIKIEREKLDVAKKQYTLDSLQYYSK